MQVSSDEDSCLDRAQQSVSSSSSSGNEADAMAHVVAVPPPPVWRMLLAPRLCTAQRLNSRYRLSNILRLVFGE